MLSIRNPFRAEPKDEAPAPTGLSMDITIDRKVNLAKFEMGEARVCVHGLTKDTSMDEVAALLANGSLAYKVMCEDLKQKIARMRAEADGAPASGGR